LFAAPTNLTADANKGGNTNGQTVILSATFRFEVTGDKVNIQSSSIKVEPKISAQSASVNKAASSKISKKARRNGKVVKGKTQYKSDPTSKGSQQQKKNIPKKQSKTVSANGSYKASKASKQKRKAAKKVPIENIAVKKEDPSPEKSIKIQF
jgi:hypothetical protein